MDNLGCAATKFKMYLFLDTTYSKLQEFHSDDKYTIFFRMNTQNYHKCALLTTE